MPDFADIEKDAEKEASSHPQQADDIIKDADKEADQVDGGKESGVIDKGAAAAEKKIGGDGAPGTPSTPAS